MNGWWCVLCLWFLFYSGVDVGIFLFWESTYYCSLARLFALLSLMTPGACVGEWVCCCFRCLLARDGRDYGRVGQAGTRERSGREMWGNKWGEGGGFVNRF